MTGNSEQFTPFDVADYLDDLDDVAGYLALALEESSEDPSAVPRALGVIARSQNMSELKVTSALGLRFELHSVA